MEVKLFRKYKKSTYTIGKLTVYDERTNAVIFTCDTLEDKDRGLRQSLPVAVNRAWKSKGITAIPTGRYRITLDVVSPKYSKRKQYDFCQGKLPRLLNVPAFDGILIHAGNTANDTEGCLLVGENKAVGKVLNSMVTFKKLYEVLKKAEGYIWITIE